MTIRDSAGVREPKLRACWRDGIPHAAAARIPFEVRRRLVVHVEQIELPLPENSRDGFRIGTDPPAVIDGKDGACTQGGAPRRGDSGRLLRRLRPPGDRSPPFQKEREAERADDGSDGRTIALPDVFVIQNGDVEPVPVDPLEEFEKTVRPTAPLPAGVEEEDLHQGKPDGPLGDTLPPARTRVTAPSTSSTPMASMHF